MATADFAPPPRFTADSTDLTGERWRSWKQRFEFFLLAKGLDQADGKRKVAVLLTCMGDEAIRLYSTFTFNPAVAADEDAGIVAQPAEDKNDLETVLRKFDGHYGCKKYRNVRRQAFLNRQQADGESIMNFIADLKHKIKDCEYGDAAESILCDRIIQGIRDEHVKTRLLDLTDDELTVDNAIRICRASELTSHQVKVLGESAQALHARSSSGSSYQWRRGRGQGRGRGQPMDGRSARRDEQPRTCARCCKPHGYGQCPAYDKFCGNCGEKGHFMRSAICPRKCDDQRSGRRMITGKTNSRGRGRGRRRGQRVHKVNDDAYVDNDNMCDDVDNVYGEQNEKYDDDYVTMFEQFSVNSVNTGSRSNDDWSVDVMILDEHVSLEIDSGASCNILSLQTVKRLGVDHCVKHSNVTISGIHGDAVKAHGTVELPCEYNNETRMLKFQVLANNRNINILGRHDCVEMGLIARVNIAMCDEECRKIVNKYSDVFSKTIGCVPGEYDIKIDHTVKPVVHAPRTVPAPIRDQVKKELDLLEEQRIIEKVTEPTDWVNSMVVVRKKNGRVRICIDPTNLNEAIQREHFPMSTIEDISTRLSGSKYFSVLDANMGYFQIKLSEKSSYLTAFNTPFGRYRYLRLPMGVKSSSDVYQRKMMEIFGDIAGVEVVVDDILIHGATIKEHNKRLEEVLERAKKANLKLNSDKCKIAVPEVDFVGHKFTGDGMRPTDDRVKAITEMRSPENRAELETILGMVAYVAKFIPNLSELNAPLRHLKKQDSEWSWGQEEETAFRKIKEALSSKPLLKYYDVTKPIILSVDASMKGLGAAAMQDGGVIAYASRALTATEQRYAQIEKEMLAIVFGCGRFHKLIYGKSDVTIETDHKPLESLMKKPIHAAPMRIQKMMLKLQPYDFNLIYVNGKSIGLADCLSRLPHDGKQEPLMDDDLMVCSIETNAHGDHKGIATATAQDETLQELMDVIKRGWPSERTAIPRAVMPYWNCRDELSTYNGIVFKGERICIPKSMREKMLRIIHSSHLGIVKCKQRARDVVYWPGMNKEIEDIVGKCEACLENRDKPAKEPMIIAPIPSLPWTKVACDLFQLGKNHYAVLVDYYSNYIEVSTLPETTAAETISFIKGNIARYGIMQTLVTDNGPQFTCQEFREFQKTYGFEHLTSSPHHQQSDGLAENAVKIMKRMLKKCKITGEDPHLALLELRNTPRDNGLGSPAQRLMGRRTRTRLPISEKLLRPATIEPIQVQQQLQAHRERQKHYYDQNTKPQSPIHEGDSIRVITPQGWQPAEFVKKHAMPNSYIIKSGPQGREYRRNRKELMITREKPHRIRPQPEINIAPTPRKIQMQPPIVAPKTAQTHPQVMQTPPSEQPQRKPPEPGRSRFGRVRMKPKYLKDYV